MERRGGPQVTSSQVTGNHHHQRSSRGGRSGRGRKTGQALKFHNFVANERPVTSSSSTNCEGKTLTHCLREEHGTKQITVSHWTSSAPASPEKRPDAKDEGHYDDVQQKLQQDSRDNKKSKPDHRQTRLTPVTPMQGQRHPTVKPNFNLFNQNPCETFSSQIKSPLLPTFSRSTMTLSSSESSILTANTDPSSSLTPQAGKTSGLSSNLVLLPSSSSSNVSSSSPDKALKFVGAAPGLVGDTSSTTIRRKGIQTGFQEGIKIPRNHFLQQSRQQHGEEGDAILRRGNQEEKEDALLLRKKHQNLLNLHHNDLQDDQQSILEALLAKNFSTALIANTLNRASTTQDRLHAHPESGATNPLLDHHRFQLHHHDLFPYHSLLLSSHQEQQQSIQSRSRISSTKRSSATPLPVLSSNVSSNLKTTSTNSNVSLNATAERSTKLPLDSMKSPFDATTKRASTSVVASPTNRGLFKSSLYSPSFHVPSSSPTSDASSSSSTHYSPSSSPSIKVNKRKPLFVRRVITSEFKE